VNASGVLSALPIRSGHFLLESGYHANLWVTLDALFVDLAKVEPLVAALAEKVRPYEVTAVCGPVVGGALLALAMARELGMRFYFTSPTAGSGDGFFQAKYALPRAQARMVKGQRVAVVDDAISAGSSVRATKAALDEAGASTVVVAALVTFGDTARDHFKQQGISIESLEQREFTMWKPAECPLCAAGTPLVVP
jgi:orotate phosphoribosyltransferase